MARGPDGEAVSRCPARVYINCIMRHQTPCFIGSGEFNYLIAL